MFIIATLGISITEPERVDPLAIRFPTCNYLHDPSRQVKNCFDFIHHHFQSLSPDIRLVTLHFFFQDKDNLVVTMEFVQGGDTAETVCVRFAPTLTFFENAILIDVNIVTNKEASADTLSKHTAHVECIVAQPSLVAGSSGLPLSPFIGLLTLHSLEQPNTSTYNLKAPKLKGTKVQKSWQDRERDVLNDLIGNGTALNLNGTAIDTVQTFQPNRRGMVTEVVLPNTRSEMAATTVTFAKKKEKTEKKAIWIWEHQLYRVTRVGTTISFAVSSPTPLVSLSSCVFAGSFPSSTGKSRLRSGKVKTQICRSVK
ncbi:hypothetical protein BLNAU_21763 [Blattamonas nauphoetae]|uniref:Uncharacterized protein n=1 Tax=Blattamonas nauphoetae TaxID=2049346 RepID=A0ABQ9WVJ0_9EUKA|nr:hypothetical protein BLNAU_21763 [Blattamonas nauphoetae]